METTENIVRREEVPVELGESKAMKRMAVMFKRSSENFVYFWCIREKAPESRRKAVQCEILSATSRKKLRKTKRGTPKKKWKGISNVEVSWLYAFFSVWIPYGLFHRQQHLAHFVRRMVWRKLDAVSEMWRVGSWRMHGCRKWDALSVSYRERKKEIIKITRTRQTEVLNVEKIDQRYYLISRKVLKNVCSK